MADVRFVLYDLEEAIIEPHQVTAYEFSSDWDAPCDSVRLYFCNDYPLPEIYRVEMLVDDEKVFNGYVDTQREEQNKNGFSCFLFVRSTACLLTDCQAKPYTYYCPESKALYRTNAMDKGFHYDLPNIYSDIQYQVSKGTSCYGAINDFVYGITGDKIIITPDNVLRLLKRGREVSLDTDAVISEKRSINRGKALMGVDYKVVSQTDYRYHRISRFMQGKRILSKKVKNLSGVPEYKREYALSNEMESANADYICYEVKLLGYQKIAIGDKIHFQSLAFGEINGAVASSVTHMLDSTGQRTIVRFNIPMDLEEFSYVDE